MFLTTRGLVLRYAKYKESDAILTVLTEHEGKITVHARGAKAKASRYKAAVQHLVFSEMTLFGNRGRWSLNEAETLEQFIGLRADLRALALASYFAELLEALSDEDSPNVDILRLGLNALYALSNDYAPQELIKAVTELRILCLGGYEPQLEQCAFCGKTDIVKPRFSAAEASVLCADCVPNARGEILELCEGSLSAMRHAVHSDMKKMYSFSLEAQAQARLSRAAESHVFIWLERSFGTLDYWKRLT